MGQKKKFCDTRSREQIDSDYKDHVDHFKNSDITSHGGEMMRKLNLSPYRVKNVKSRL